VNLEASATDGGGCTNNGWLKWTVLVDLWGNGTTDYEFSSFLPSTDNNLGNDTNGNGIPDRYVAPTSSGGTVKVPSFVLESEMSTHKVSWKVTDGCGNVTSCESTFMVVDKKAPTPYCVSLSTAVMENCQVELWAIDFNKGSFDNCTPQNGLCYTFNGEMPVWTKLGEVHYFKGLGQVATIAEYNAGNAQKWVPEFKSSAKIFDKDDVVNSPITIKMSVWDSNGNTDYCEVDLSLIDNQGGCNTTPQVSCDCAPNQYTGMAVVTCNAEPGTNGAVGAIIDVRNNATAPRGTDWAPSISKIYPSNWTIDSIGQIFSIAIDDNSNVYLAASDVYDQQFNPDVYGPAQIFKASPPSFRALPFATLPNTGGSLNGTGGMVYDTKNSQLIVSNLEDGKLYRFNNNGTVVETIDPFGDDDNTSGIVSKTEQVWGLGINNENGSVKVYFGRIDDTERSMYSITLNNNGSFPSKSAIKKEINSIPGVGKRISDIEFSNDGKAMILTERGTFFTTGAHDSRVMRYNLNGTTWTIGLKYEVGANVNDVYPGLATAGGENSAGGIDFGYGSTSEAVNGKCDAIVWSSAHWMRTSDGNLYYGIQGMDANGNKPSSDPISPNMKTDIIVDFDGTYDNFNQKGKLGDVEVFRCKKSGTILSSIEGRIENVKGEGIEQVSISIDANRPEYPKYMLANKAYKVGNLQSDTYKLTPSKTDDYLNGVSTLDLVLIQRHILGISKLDSPEKLIAADINKDGKVAANDLVELRRLILGMINKLPNNDSWAFVPKSHVYINPLSPFDAPRSMTLNVTTDITNADFMGIKIGDVTGDAKAVKGNDTDNRGSRTLNFKADNQTLVTGQTVNVEITSDNFHNIYGYQFTAKMKGLELVDVKSGSINVENTFGEPEANKMTMSWSNERAVSAVAGEVLFTVVMKATSNGNLSEMFTLGSEVTRSESYGLDMTANRVEMKIGGKAGEYALYQNEPNPFRNETEIKFELAKAGKATLTFVDIAGKQILIKEINGIAGMNTLRVMKSEIKMTGVLYYQLESGDFKAIKSMIVVE
jgi:hypothetical protein